jgi:uncharacterized protein YfaS (alpha-2-macroglobulin family)
MKFRLPDLRSFTKKGPKLYLTLSLAAVALVLFFVPWKSPQAPVFEASVQQELEDKYGAYIAAYTSGVISAADNITVRFAADVISEEQIGTEARTDIFDFEPAISGKASWQDLRTLSFKPDTRLRSGQAYQVEVAFQELMETEPDIEDFAFQVQVMAQNYDFSFEGMEPYEPKELKKQKFAGSLVTADVADAAEVEKIVQAKQKGNTLKVSWQHLSDGRQHSFIIENVARLEQETEVVAEFSGESIGVKKSVKENLRVPALGDFSLMEAKVAQSEQQYVSLRFSDPLQENQNLEGLITIEGNANLRYIIAGNEIKVYASSRLNGDLLLEVNSGIKNILGYSMKNGHSQSLRFEQSKPAVRLVKSGTILPSTDGLVLPFEAISLKAVDVQIVEIFEENVSQFLQVNELSGTRELTRVGRPVVRKTVPLNASGVTDFGKWTRFTLDLEKYLKAKPGAIYQLSISFRKEHAAYACADSEESALTSTSTSDYENWDDNGNNNEYYYSYYDYEDYEYSDRDDPCTSSYYYSTRHTVKTNILASDIGLIAKRAADDRLLVVATDIKTAQPISGLTLKVQNYQQRVIASGTTDAEGLATIELPGKAFLLVAERGAEKGYLKLDDGNALSLSNFDVSGEKITKGLKGFIYAERDVWRPGDAIYLNFMLQDAEKTLPENYPVAMELYNPQGQLIKKQVNANPVSGLYAFHTSTSPDAPTGNWQARVHVGGTTFTKSVKIETVKPNRLKIRLGATNGSLQAGQKNVMELNARWLHGATAKNLDADVEMVLVADKTSFPKFTGYNFDDPGKKFSSSNSMVFDDAVNEQGTANFSVELPKQENAPGRLKAVFKTKVFEEGGEFSIDRIVVPVHPYVSYVGVKVDQPRTSNWLETNTQQTANIVTVDSAGKPVARSKVNLELIKLNWSWWWDQDDSGTASYMARSHQNVVAKGQISTGPNGQGNWNFQLDYPDWGRFLLRATDPISGHSTGQIIYIDWPNTYDRSSRSNPDGASMLSLSTNKDKYQVGEEAVVSFPSPAEGRALVSIENGSQILSTRWVEVKMGQTELRISVSEKMAPNAYAHISLLQPHRQTTNDLPVRLYGVVPLLVEDPATHLQPQIKMAEKLRPETPFEVQVSEAGGHGMAYTLAIVDEGLLDLTRFRTPEPWKAFYKREALGVKTWDMYQHVIGAYGGRMERLLAIGGDEAGRKVENNNVNRFKPVVKFVGPYYLEEGETARHELTLDPYVGSVRVMVVAGEHGAYGQAEKTVPVTQPLMLLGTLPRVLGPGEEVMLPATVFAMEKEVKNVSVKAKTNNLFNLQGNRSQQLQFTEPDDKLAYFSLNVQEKTGAGRVELEAQSGSNTATYAIDIPVRNPNPPITQMYQAVVKPGANWQSPVEVVGMPGTNFAQAEVSTLPSLNLGKRLQYLMQYPYGCVEQTTSSAFPQLYLSQIMELSAKEKAQTERNIKAAIERLKLFQLSSGAFAYWPGNTEENEWGTNYAGHFLTEAGKIGYQVPDDMLRRWKNYQRKTASEWRYKSQDDYTQAYRLYTLALAGAPEMGAMNRFRENYKTSGISQWRLAAAYALAGQEDVAQTLTAGLQKKPETYTRPGSTFGSSLRDEAMILETLSLLNRDEEAAQMLLTISEQMSSEKWLSTQTTAYCLIAGGKLYGKYKKDAPLVYSSTFNGKSSDAKTGQRLVQQELVLNEAGSNSYQIKNTGESPIFVRVFSTGTPLHGQEVNTENNLNIKVAYRNMAGDIVDPSALEQGTDFKAEVTVSNPGLRGDYTNLALSQILASGWEIHNNRLNETASNSKNFDYQDIRDDRVYTFFDLRAGEKKTFTVLLNASYAGKFYLPAVSCEAMYDNSISASQAGQWVQVNKVVNP